MTKREATKAATRRPDARPPGGRDGETPGVNEVHLVGRVTGAPEERILPSGAQLVTFRVAVPRGATVMTRGSTQTVDVLDCVAWAADARRAAGSRQVGDLVDLRGAIRRRFFRGPQGAVSRVELEVLSLRRASPTSSEQV